MLLYLKGTVCVSRRIWWKSLCVIVSGERLRSRPIKSSQHAPLMNMVKYLLTTLFIHIYTLITYRETNLHYIYISNVS